MSRSKVEGTKIAQAAKDLNVTSVTIRRYIQEFEIETATDENGIKVLPAQALEELQEIRKLKEDGLTNPKVMEQLEEMRSNKTEEKPSKAKARGKATKVVATKAKKAVVEVDDDEAESEAEEEVEVKPEPVRKVRATKVLKAHPKEVVEEKEKDEDESSADSDSGEEQSSPGESGDGEKFMHALTCQTCAKTFEHNNPRLRDCLDCYRAKRKERRRGGGEKHKKVIENPLATQVLSKQSPLGSAATAGVEAKDSDRLERPDRLDRPDRLERPDRQERPDRTERDPAARADREPRRDREPREPRDREPRDRQERVAVAATAPAAQRSSEPSSWAQMQKPVRSYRKAIEETRLITGSLKRRLERPDLPEGERRWLEQVYAYQLILHQGWRHLAEYKSGNPTQKPPQED
jgi:DNA-binding transcriptional MerR regulator